MAIDMIKYVSGSLWVIMMIWMIGNFAMRVMG